MRHRRPAAIVGRSIGLRLRALMRCPCTDTGAKIGLAEHLVALVEIARRGRMRGPAFRGESRNGNVQPSRDFTVRLLRSCRVRLLKQPSVFLEPRLNSIPIVVDCTIYHNLVRQSRQFTRPKLSLNSSDIQVHHSGDLVNRNELLHVIPLAMRRNCRPAVIPT